MTMQELVPLLGKIAGIKTPTNNLPFLLLYFLAAAQEVYAKISGKPILLSLATVRLMRKEAGRSHFIHTKSEQKLQLKFRPIEQNPCRYGRLVSPQWLATQCVAPVTPGRPLHRPGFGAAEPQKERL